MIRLHEITINEANVVTKGPELCSDRSITRVKKEAVKAVRAGKVVMMFKEPKKEEPSTETASAGASPPATEVPQAQPEPAPVV